MNIISRIAVVAVVLGAMALFIVLSGFSGLKDFALEFTDVFDSDLKVLPQEGKTFEISAEMLSELRAIPEIVAVSQVLEERVFIQYENKHHIAYLKGVDQSFGQVTPLDSLIFVGNWFQPDMEEVVIGFGISSKLSLGVRDYGKLMELYVPKPGTGQINALDPTSAFSSAKVVASGIYEINEDVNSKFVFSDLRFAQNFLGQDSTATSYLELKLLPNTDEKALLNKIHQVIPGEFITKNRIQQNDALYKMLNSENLFTYLFVSLIAAIAIFNLAGTIIMIILEKRSNIKTLYFLGLTVSDIRRIFFYNGMMMTLIGVVIGLLLGSILVWAQLQFGFVKITSSLAYPVKFNMINLLIVFATILVLGGIASKMASLRVTEKLLA